MRLSLNKAPGLINEPIQNKNLEIELKELLSTVVDFISRESSRQSAYNQDSLNKPTAVNNKPIQGPISDIEVAKVAASVDNISVENSIQNTNLEIELIIKAVDVISLKSSIGSSNKLVSPNKETAVINKPATADAKSSEKRIRNRFQKLGRKVIYLSYVINQRKKYF